MLRFFRLIRKKLIEQDNARKYFFYAIGEIFLVVIGILIALQINNWNQGLNERNEELTYLRNLRGDLLKDRLLIQEKLTDVTNKVEASARLTAMSESKHIDDFYGFVDDMFLVLIANNFTPNQSTFQEMLNSGKLSIIKNERIKRSLLLLDEEYRTIQGVLDHLKREYESYLWDEYVDHLSWRDFYDLDVFRRDLEPAIDTAFVEANRQELYKDALELLQIKRFENGLYLYEFNIRYMINVLEGTQKQADDLIELLNQEID